MPRNNATVAPFSSLAAALRVLAMSCVLALVFGASNARATTDWQSGDLVSYNQAAWVILPQASATLTNNFSAVYPPFGVVEIGVPGSGGYSIVFSSPDTILHFLPTTGAPAALTTDLNNPVTTGAGIFAGDVLALQLDIDFADHGVLAGSSGFVFGDLVVHDLTGSAAGLNGLTVRDVDVILNSALGGEATAYQISDLSPIADELAASFNDGTVTSLAQDHLSAPEGSSPVPEPAGWAMMLVGFALIGGATRRKSTKAPKLVKSALVPGPRSFATDAR
jgi:hypothetical protein